MAAAVVSKDWLKITEVFVSLQGEARACGWPTVFVRLTGCPLRCTYCDSAYAFYGGTKRTVDELVAEVANFEVRHVCVTGGEPLAQPAVHSLLTQLCDRGFDVSLETSGALDCSKVDVRVARVIDIKTPSSGESARNLWPNLSGLRERDQVKFVIGDRADYEYAKGVIAERRLDKAEVWFSPSFGLLEPRQLADWIVDDRLKVRFQIQVHKLLWGDVPGK